MFVPHASEIWIESYGPNCTKFWAIWQKTGFLKNHLWQSVDTILGDASVHVAETIIVSINMTTTIFQSSKNYGSPTRVTRLKVALNMADPISLNKNLP